MNKKWWKSKEWWEETAERAVRTFCQTLVSMVTVGQSIVDVDWIGIIAISATASVTSVAMRIAWPSGKKEGSEE